jgi:hypothetical protein
MYPLDDDNLDRLSQEAADRFEVEAGASGWDHLEQRLNKEMPQEKKRRRFLFWLFLITATTGGALTGILKYQSVTPLAKNITSAVTPVDKTNDTRTPRTTQNEAVSDNYETPITTAAPEENKLPVGNNKQSIATGTNTKPGVSTSEPENNQTVTTTTGTVATKPLPKPAKKTTNRIVSKPGRVRIEKRPTGLNDATTAAPDNGNNGADKPSKQKSGKRRSGTASNQHKSAIPTAEHAYNATYEPENDHTNAEPATTGQPVEANKEVAAVTPTLTDSTKSQVIATPAVDSTKTLAKKQPKKKDDKIQQPLEFGVIAGPDMSAVAFGPLYKPGYNFGVQVGYRFNNRWSVNAGAIYTKKFYKTDSSHFEYKNNPWPANKTISRVEGNCSMWEFPVNVRYDFLYNNKRRWFASTGLSTYLMDKEDYDAYYRWNGSGTYDQPLGTDTNSTYLFSILNLSVGMERSLGKRFSLQAEPYLKIPLRDLGMGNMRMNSYGILFTLKYNPFLKSKRSTSNK